MKVAVLVSGSPRFCDEFDNFILNLESCSSIDYFIHLWNDNPLPDKPRHFEYRLISDNWRQPSLEWANEKIKNNLPFNHNLVDLKIEDSGDLIYPDANPYHANIHTVWRMFYSWKKVNLMFQDYENINGKYDVVIRTRPDVGIDSKLNLEKYNNTNSVHVPSNGWFGRSYKICDILAISNSENMKIYNSIIDSALDYHKKEGVDFHPESLVAYHLQKNNISVVKESWNFRLRPEMINKDGIHTVNFGRWE